MSLEELQALKDRLEKLLNDLQTKHNPRERLRVINEVNGLLFLLRYGSLQR
jgi:hypothetical protein